MKVNCYQVSDGPQLKACDYNFALDSIRQKHTKVWIDIQDAKTFDLEEKFDDLEIQGLIRNFSLESRNHPGFYPIKPLVLMVIPVQLEIQDSNSIEYLAILFCPEFLITIRNSKMARFRKKITAEDSFDLLPDDTIGGIIATLLMGLSLDSLRKTAILSDLILALEAQMEHEPGSVHIEEISGKRFELLTLESIVQGQLPIIETIIASDSPAKTQKPPLNISGGQLLI